MKKSLLFLSVLFVSIVISNAAIAADVYAEYEITGMTPSPVISKMYSKNGNIRTEVNMKMAGSQINTTTLMLKSNPGVTMVFNSMTKTYTETKSGKNAAVKNFTVKVIGNEKIGKYNCNHVRMTSDGKSWDVWYSKDLPPINFPVNGSNISDDKIVAELKSKGVTGMPVKIAFLKPGTTLPSMTMLLKKYEPKNLDASLFTIPAGYKKSSVNFNAEKMKNMSPAERKEMMMKMMREQMKQ
ncbi:MULTISPECIES: DUF4412 domain-containing protein [unclassified Pedobacter]|uniref:DUF4412 domain-containing protein n=1 Tax=unclassified Pedobacter TaxID=2628915 RepID=UPI001E308AF1|nr:MULTISPECIES: DUF4412 domain-containing protein [unclassified Pedobacter]